MNEVTRHFYWHQNFVPWGLSAPALGLYTCFKSLKHCIKSDLKEFIFFFNLQYMNVVTRRFCWHQIFIPWGLFCPCPGAIYMYKILKIMYKLRLQWNGFETFNKWPKWQDVPVDIKISSKRGLSAPVPGLYTWIKSRKNMYKIRLQRDFWPKWQQVSIDIKIVSLGFVSHNLRLYTFIKSWGWSGIFDTCNKWPKWWGLPVDVNIFALMGCLPLPKGYVHA